MQVSFKTKKLEAAARSERLAMVEFGEAVGRKYVQRIGILYAAPDMEAVGSMKSLRLHPLKGDRAGQFAIDLTGPVRLIVTFSGEHMTVVRVEEVSKHYD